MGVPRQKLRGGDDAGTEVGQSKSTGEAQQLRHDGLPQFDVRAIRKEL